MYFVKTDIRVMPVGSFSSIDRYQVSEQRDPVSGPALTLPLVSTQTAKTMRKIKGHLFMKAPADTTGPVYGHPTSVKAGFPL
jgi:hypothetical protein